MKKTLSTPTPANSEKLEEELALLCVHAALDKKAENPVILDLRNISTVADYFVILSGTSEPQIKAIAGSIRQKIREEKQRTPYSDDAYPGSRWIVIDYGSVIVHIFHPALRAVYDLESLWGDAPRVTLSS